MARGTRGPPTCGLPGGGLGTLVVEQIERAIEKNKY